MAHGAIRYAVKLASLVLTYIRMELPSMLPLIATKRLEAAPTAVWMAGMAPTVPPGAALTAGTGHAPHQVPVGTDAYLGIHGTTVPATRTVSSKHAILRTDHACRVV